MLDLGFLPLANGLLNPAERDCDVFPAVLHVCSHCATAQLGYCPDASVLYADYKYVTPQSEMLSRHYQQLVAYLKAHHGLSKSSSVLEIGSNIGHFLQYLQPCVGRLLGVDPAKNIVQQANAAGIPTLCRYFDKTVAREIRAGHGEVDFIFARHCFAHNEKPWKMLQGVDTLLSPDGVFVIENAYFPDTVARCEFDQIYHEHMYYFGMRAIHYLAQQYGFVVTDCLHSDIHGGTMLYILQRSGTASARVRQALRAEKDMHRASFYKTFVRKTNENKATLQALLQRLGREGKTIHVYGASAKSTTLLNYFGIDTRITPLAVDSTSCKQGMVIPVVNIPIISEEEACLNPPDYYLLTIWNYRDEIIEKVRSAGNYDSLFIIPHPEVQIVTK